jgi:hypothetical protein
MATTNTSHPQKWETIHENGPFPLLRHHDTIPASINSIPEPFDRYRGNATEIQRLLQECMQRNEGFRAYGSRWSLSDIAHHPHNMHRNHSMNLKLEIQQADMHAASLCDRNNLMLFECGNRIGEISQALATKGKSLKASGASNGQTIAGVIATGVHGSFFDFGAVQDFVVGLNLIIGPQPNDIVYVERSSKPALSDAFAQRIGARVIRNDDMFNSALVGLGAFGFIHGVVVEAEDEYLLKRYVGTIKESDAMSLAKTLNFDHAPQLIRTNANEILAERDSNGRGLRPCHYKILVNPYKKSGDLYVEIMYKKPYAPGYPNPMQLLAGTVSPDLLSFVTNCLTGRPRTVAAFLRTFEGLLMPKPNERSITGRLGEIFFDSFHKGAAFAFSIAFNHSRIEEGLAIYRNVMTGNKAVKLPGAVGIRFVKASDATLAFTRFPITCVMEINGTLPKSTERKRARAVEEVEEFSERIMKEFEQKGIPYTLHWGKNAKWGRYNLVKAMYGSKVDLWKSCRQQLLQPAGTEALFSNPFIKRLGLG